MLFHGISLNYIDMNAIKKYLELWTDVQTHASVVII